MQILSVAIICVTLLIILLTISILGQKLVRLYLKSNYRLNRYDQKLAYMKEKQLEPVTINDTILLELETLRSQVSGLELKVGLNGRR